MKNIRNYLCALCLLFALAPLSVSAAAEEAPETVVAGEPEISEKPQIEKGWHQSENGNYYYVNSDGMRVHGWLTLKGKTYYLAKYGFRVTGWKKIGEDYYYFKSNGARKNGWLKIGTKKYYLDPENNGIRTCGVKKIGDYYYCFDSRGRMKTGWVTVDSKKYYCLSNGKAVTGWYTVKQKKYYFKSNAQLASGWTKIDGYYYYFNQDGTILKNCFAPDGYYADAEGKRLKKNTIKGLLQTALQPVGSTMYIWGGGWDAADAAAGPDAVTMGVSPLWKKYFRKQNAGYDYRLTRWQSRNGLDCSGYVGWVIYNTFNKKSGNSGYVMGAQIMAQRFAGKGWGVYTPAYSVKDFRAGDIMSTSSGHVYIVLGQCSDGSVVLLHSSPPGVQITGTCSNKGNTDSYAVQLATKYMKKFYPQWYKKYPDSSRGSSYLTQYGRMRWNLSGSCMLTDPEGYADMNAKQILEDLFSDASWQE